MEHKEDYVIFDPEEVKLDLENAKEFVKRIKKYITEEQEQDTD
jgi:hypothetical protein